MPPQVILAVLGGVGTLALGSAALAQRTASVLRPKNLLGLFFVCLCSFTLRYSNIIALKHLPLTIFYIVAFTSPLVIAALSSALKHEVLSPVKIGCLIAGFLGVAFAIAPRLTMGGEVLGYLAALSSVLFFSVQTIVLRSLSQTESVQSLSFFIYLATAVAGFLWVLLEPPVMVASNLIVILMIGAMAHVLGNVLFMMALKHTVSTNVTQLHYTQIVLGALLGYWIWNDVPTWNLVVGSAVIIISSLIVARQARRNEALLDSRRFFESAGGQE